MVSGTAEISYDASKGEIILTSAGGVIKNVLLLEGEWLEKPEHVSKGYAAEMAECQRYYRKVSDVFVVVNTPNVGVGVCGYKNMRIIPTLSVINGETYRVNVAGTGYNDITINTAYVNKEKLTISYTPNLNAGDIFELEYDAMADL